ncbi:MAG TPA: prepilin-type N-terminal cleavage/methylation domain-containing protein [Dongiaceae bacterium]|nr:prepilin-type N-terminal cleavage/methylation domain-containing protein [Dongiaceae bacterium]
MQWVKRQSGFTIVELLIVVVVIAILAAITIVSYNGITSRARSLAIPNSLRNTAEMMQTSIVTGDGTAPTTLPSTVKADNDVVLQLAAPISGSSADFCINAYRISSYEVGSYDSTGGQVQPYLCPGVLIGTPVGGSLPTVPLNTNLIASDFSTWTLSGGVTYDSINKQLVFSGTSGSALSPLVRMGGQSSGTTLSYELYSTVAAPNFTPQAGCYSGSSYFASDGTTPATSSAGYTTNGNAQAVPLSAWTSRTWTITTGPNVQYVRYTINLASSTYTSNSFKVRNPSISRQS